MSRIFNTLCLIFILFCSTAAAIEEKIYLNEDEIKNSHDSFYIHQGHNVWLQTSTLHRDQTGLYTFSSNLCSHFIPGGKTEYIKTWRCPYCHHYWPIGQKCQNKDCPSKY